MRIFLILIVMLSLQGCVFFFGNTGALGFGKRTVEYYEDGKIKSRTFESNSPLENILNFGKR